MATQSGENALKRRIGFWGLLAMCVGINVGGALFALTSLAGTMTGPALPLAMLLSATPALLAVIPYSMLSSAMPTTSGTYRYIQLVDPSLAVVCLLTLAVCICIGGQPLYAKAFGVYLKPLTGLDPVIGGLLVLTFFYLVNLLGVRLTAFVQTLLFFVLLSALVLFIVQGLPKIDPRNLSPMFPRGALGVLVGAGLLYTFCAGGFFIIDLGGEVRKAGRMFPRVLLTGLLIVVVLYVLILLTTVGVIPWTRLKGKSLITVAAAFMGRPMQVYFIVGGALVAAATTINIVFTVISRGFMVLAGEGVLPEHLGRVNSRFGTPHWGLTLAYAVSALSLILIPSLMFFGSMLNLGLVFAVTMVALAGLRVPRKYPGLLARSTLRMSPRLIKTASGLVIGLNALIFAFFILAVKWSSVLFAAIALATFLYTRCIRERLDRIKHRLDPIHGAPAAPPFAAGEEQP